MPLILFSKYKNISLSKHILLFAILNIVLFIYPVAQYIEQHIGLLTITGSQSFVISIFLVSTLSIILFSILGIISPLLYQVILSILILFNSSAIYFITKYQVFLDKTMMSNILNTREDEAFSYLEPQLFLYILFLGIIPAYLVFKIKITKRNIKHLLFFNVGTVITFTLVAYLSSSSWVWIDKHAKYLGGLVLPWSYIVNGVNSQAVFDSTAKKQELLPVGQIISDSQVNVVLVIGETARVKNFQLFGYEKATTPLLNKQDLSLLSPAESCSTYTTASIRCILSHKDTSSEFGTFYEPLTSYLTRLGIDVVWLSANWGQPAMNVAKTINAKELRKNCSNEHCSYDGVLLDSLGVELEQLKSKSSLLVMHQKGSHGPNYSERYPDSFEHFTPVCKSSDIKSCTQEELVNAYDNTIYYTDYLLSNIIEKLKGLNNKSLLLYVSDHGESLGEKGFYLHGTPKSIAPKEQYQVPFIMWMSDAMKKEYSIVEKEQYSQINIFHTIISALNVKTPVHNPELDLLKIKDKN